MRERKTESAVKEQMKVKSEGRPERQFIAGWKNERRFVRKFPRTRPLVLLRAEWDKAGQLEAVVSDKASGNLIL